MASNFSSKEIVPSPSSSPTTTRSVGMASNSTSNEIVPSPSSSAKTTRSLRLRSLFSSRHNCFSCCSSSPTTARSVGIASNSTSNEIVQSPSLFPSNAMPSTSTTHAPDTNAFEPSTSTFEQIEIKNEHSNAFEGIIPSASTSSRPTMTQKKVRYEVFINHRGPDVKYTLATNLYETLTGMGLRVFLDKEELQLGDYLPAEIEEAIQGASLHIAIFSQKYAQSPWCLAELAFMVRTGTPIIPVFYYVDTDVVRYAKGVYAQAFSRHEEKRRYASELLGEWKNALQNVSYNFGGIIHNEEDEARLLKNIVNRVLIEIKHQPYEVAKHPIGLYETVTEFERTTLQYAENYHSVQTVGICGMGGSGKTTLAKQIYNNKYRKMDKSSFLLDVRDAASRSKLHKKQKKLLEDLGLHGVSIENIEEGKRILSSQLQHIRVLIILDDVDSVDQLDALVPTRDNLGWDSLIVVTSRNLRILQSWGISSIYNMKALSQTHARQLFCWHAFLQSSPHHGFEDLVEKFLNVSKGLPLSLKVIGAQLYGISNKSHWEIELHKISRILPNDIKARLKISYDALDDEEKEVFLDIACLFIGERVTPAIAAWDGLGLSGLHSWEQLLNKCLVESDGGWIRMHDHLRDLGREIAKKQSPYRLWSPQQVINVDNELQPIALRGIKYIESGSTSEIEFPECSIPISEGGKLKVNTNRGSYTLEPSSLGLKFLHVQRNCYDQIIGELSRELVWLRWDDIEHSNLLSLKSLKNLRVLEIHQDTMRISSRNHYLEELWETDKNAPTQLRELVINFCSEFQGFPKSIGSLKYLKKLELRSSWELRSLPEEFCLLQSLEHLRLTLTGLASLPNNFGDLRNLRYVDLSCNRKLLRLPVSFKELKFLQHLNLHECLELTFESDILENMTKLEYLNINYCHRLEELPRHITNQPSLTELHCVIQRLMEVPVSIGQLRKLERISIGGQLLTGLPISMGNLSSLTSLKISYCANLKSLPDSFAHLNFLEELEISICKQMKCLPDSLGCLHLLRSLDLSGLGVQSLPESVGQLVNLEKLHIYDCPITELDVGVGLFTSLKDMELTAIKVSKISISNNSYPVLVNLCLGYNTNLTHIEVLPDSIKSLHLQRNTCLTHIEVLPDSIDLLDISENTNLTHIAVLPNSVRIIYLRGSPKLEALPSFAQTTFLRKFELSGCYRVKKIHGLEHCKALEGLKAHTCWEEAGIESFQRMERLRRVEIKADSKVSIEGCIQSLQKWPREQMIACARVAPDAAFSLVESIVCPNLCVVDSFTKQEIRSAPSLKWPGTTGGCVLLCYVVNCESPEILWDFLYCREGITSDYNMMADAYRGMELGKGKWVWTALFTQHSKITSIKGEWVPEWLPIRNTHEKTGEVSGVVVRGEEGRVKEALSRLWASI